ncbi:MAG: hypothetical protein HY681_10005 [Chloroflexi bacterium]|nr:hypothetical protein [Chloroflexota bacterium]
MGRAKSARRGPLEESQGYRNGHAKPRSLTLGAGTIQVRRPRIRAAADRFTSRVLLLFKHFSPQVRDLLPQLYLQYSSNGGYRTNRMELTSSERFFLRTLGSRDLRFRWQGPPLHMAGNMITFGAYEDIYKHFALGYRGRTRAAHLAIVLAALANEQAGALRLEAYESEYLFGRLTKKRVRGIHIGSARWPTPSLEDDILTHSGKDLADSVYDWLGSYSFFPGNSAAELIVGNMVHRGIFMTEGETGQLIVSPLSSAPSFQRPASTEEDLLADCQTRRSYLYRLLVSEVENGLYRREVAPAP